MDAVGKEDDRQRKRRGLIEDRENIERAKQIILQILNQDEDGALHKSRIFKAFWLAHILYAKKNPGYLSGWKIIKLPNGPGIDRGEQLILELSNAGAIRVAHREKGVHTETICMLAKNPPEHLLSKEAMAAIRSAYNIVKKESVSKISHWSHQYSRSWNLASMGSELDIYNDHIPDEVYEERKQTLREMKEAYNDLFK
jgi:hypothetical protein